MEVAVKSTPTNQQGEGKNAKQLLRKPARHHPGVERHTALGPPSGGYNNGRVPLGARVIPGRSQGPLCF